MEAVSEDFRFSSSKEYEKQMSKILEQLGRSRNSNSRKAKANEEKLECEYEELAEEYLRWSSAEEGDV